MALIRLDDFLRISEKLRQGYFSRALEAVLPFSNQTERAWKHVSHPPKHWGSIPRIREHWNECISGSRPVSSKEYVASSYPEFRNRKALSIGCGTGTNEIAWARTGLFREIDAFDLSDTISQIAGVLKPGGHHFLNDDPETLRIVESCIEREMALIAEGVIPSDFVFGVFQLRSE